jgi:hypothetical protein
MDVNECSYEQSYDGLKTALPERVEGIPPARAADAG